MMNERAPHEVRVMAEELLRVLFPSLIPVREQNITMDAAMFLLACAHRLRLASSATSGLFALYGAPPKSAAAITMRIAKAVIRAVSPLRAGEVGLRNRIAYAFVVQPHTRNLGAHLRDPEVWPCPDFRRVLGT